MADSKDVVRDGDLVHISSDTPVQVKLSMVQWFVTISFMVSIVTGGVATVLRYDSRMNGIRMDMERLDMKWQQRTTQLASQLSQSFDDKLIAAVKEVKEGVPPPEVKKAMTELYDLQKKIHALELELAKTR